MLGWAPLAWVLLGWALLLVGCGGDGMPQADPDSASGTFDATSTRPHMLLISIDTLRADHLGCYGYGRETSPHLDRLAAEGVRFQRALAPTPWTLPSHGAMLSGVDPYLLGLTAQWRQIPPQAPMLAEVLQRRGYRTAAFVDSTPRGFVGGRRGFDRGFERFQHAPHGPVETPRYDIAATVGAALAWLDGRSAAGEEEPFFLFLHSRSVHAIPTDEPCRDARCSPYFAPPPWGERFLPQQVSAAIWDNGDGRRGQDYLWWLNEEISADGAPTPALPPRRLEELIALYDGAIAYTDHHLGRLFEGLEARGLRQDTWIVVTSDHGEAFLEHRLLMHQEVYDPTLRVPLLVSPPGGRNGGEVVTSTVALEDVAVTLMAASVPSTSVASTSVTSIPGPSSSTVPLPEGVTGRPLPLGPHRGGEASDPAAERSFFSYYLFPEKFDYRAFAIERGGHKWVLHNPRSEELEQQLWTVDGLDGETPWPSTTEPSAQELALRSQLHRRLRALVQRVPMAEVDDPAHRGDGTEALSTLGYID